MTTTATPSKAAKKLTIAGKVNVNIEHIKTLSTHTALREWAVANGIDNRAAFPKFKDALLEHGINYEAMRDGSNAAKRKYVKRKCGLRIASGFPDGSFHVCYLPQGHKGKHRCGHAMGMPHQKPQECGFRWSKSQQESLPPELPQIALEALQTAKERRTEIMIKQAREEMAFDLVPVVEGDKPDSYAVYFCVTVRSQIYAKVIPGVDSMDDLKGWEGVYRLEARRE